MTTNAVIENREHLVSLLAEAAEIEHNLMCCYLYAAFSLKQGLDEDLTEVELEAVTRWRREIIRVAIDEMAHLALVSNLTAAVAGVPHFGRPNFPVSPGYHPAGIVVELAPFDASTLDHFIYLERPEGAEIPDGDGFRASRPYQRIAIPDRLMPTSHDYTTVGVLYHSIVCGFERLEQQLGEDVLFVGDPALQLGADVTNLPGVTRVRCLKTARAAIEGIIAQGEGTRDTTADSHYCRFLAIRTELRALQAARPGFHPSRPAARNPVMRHPLEPEGRVWVELHPAAELLDLVNAAYTHMLRLLVQAYSETRGVEAQRVLLDASAELMHAISPLASALTRLPASEAHPGCNAGMSFATVREYGALPSGEVADRNAVDRMNEIAAVARRLGGEIPAVAAVTDLLTRTSTRLAAGLARAARVRLPIAAVAPVTAASPVAARPVPLPVVVDGVESIEGTALTLIYEGRRCIHSRHCVLEEPGVFKANVVGPWIDPDATTTEGLVTVAHMCPSGAIRYARKDGGPEERVPPVNLIQLRENGPIGLRADIVLDGEPAGYRATLCRCGASQRKPYCDGSHNTIGFVATGEPVTRPTEPLPVRNGPLEIRPLTNGPLEVRGNLEMCAGTGRTFDRVTTVKLCRCGHSANKPYCDGSHVRVGFQS